MKSKVVSHLWIIAVKIIAFPLRCSREQQNTQQFIALLRCRLFGSEPVARRSERKPLVSAEFHIKDEPAVSPLVHRPRNQQERLQDSIFRYPSPLSQLHFFRRPSHWSGSAGTWQFRFHLLIFVLSVNLFWNCEIDVVFEQIFLSFKGNTI